MTRRVSEAPLSSQGHNAHRPDPGASDDGTCPECGAYLEAEGDKWEWSLECPKEYGGCGWSMCGGLL